MCQPKSKGGKRCAVHMHGSQAVVTHVAVVHNTDESVVRTVFRSLRREGKNLPAPSPEEVQAFAGEQRLRAQFDPNIGDERKRNTIMRRWGRSLEETPDGGTFHAWKNTMAETARRYSRKAMAVGTASVFAFTAAACAGGGGTLNETPAPSTPSPSPSVTETYNVPDGLALSGVVENDGEGEYSRVTLAEDSPFLTLDSSVIGEDAAAAYSTEDINAAHETVGRFAVEEGIDSILVDSSRTDEWWEANKSKYAPEYHADVEANLANREEGQALGAIVDNDVRDVREDSGYDLKLDGGPRLSELNITTKNVFVAPTGDIAFEYSGTAKRHAVTDDGQEGYELLTFTQTYAAKKDDSGNWLITGWQNSFSYDA